MSGRGLGQREPDPPERCLAAVADFAVRAARADEALGPVEGAAAAVQTALGAALAVVAEARPGSDGMVLRAAAGPAGREAARSFSLRVIRPLMRRAVVARRAAVAPGAIAVPVVGPRATWGAVAAVVEDGRPLLSEEVDALHRIAVLLAAAIDRAEAVRLAREDERRRIARVLHDEVLQELALAAGAPGEGAAAASAAAQRVRAAVDGLRAGAVPAPAPSLDALVREHRARAPALEIAVTADRLADALSGAARRHILAVVGEALTNVRRHAGARRAEVRVDVADGVLVASVADDGGGMAGGVAGHGVAGMRERAALLGGELAIGCPPQGGTVVALRVPLPRPSPSAAPCRLLLVDDHAAVREALALAFARDDGWEVAGQAGSLAEARPLGRDADMAIVDLALPDGDGADLIPHLLRARDGLQVLVLSAHADGIATARAVERGAAAVLDKLAPLDEVVSAARRLRDGQPVIAPSQMVELLRVAGRAREHADQVRCLVERLSAREREVLQLMADGLSAAEAAARMHIAPRTQRNHMANILAKLRLHSQAQALTFAIRHGVVTLPGREER